jgi:hypothetical protein
MNSKHLPGQPGRREPGADETGREDAPMIPGPIPRIGNRPDREDPRQEDRKPREPIVSNPNAVHEDLGDVNESLVERARRLSFVA